MLRRIWKKGNYTVGGNVNWYIHRGKSKEVPFAKFAFVCVALGD